VRVLVIGADVDAAGGYARALTARGHHVASLPSFQDVMVHGAPFSLAVVDAEGCGLPLAKVGRALRAAAQDSPMALLVLTEDGSPSHTRSFAEALANDFQPKPVSPEILADRVDFLLASQTGADDARTVTRTEKLFRQVVEGAPLALFAMDERGVLQLAEGGALRRLGFPKKAVQGRSIFDLYQDVGAFVDHSRRALTGEAVRARVEMDGRVLQTQFTPARDAARGEVTGVFALSTDVTEQARAEETLKRSEAGFRSLIEQSVDGVLVHRHGVGLFANAALVSYLGRDSARDFLDVRAAAWLPASEQPAFEALIAEIQEIGGRRYHGEILLADASGAPRPAEITSGGVLFDGELAVATSFHDLSERKKLEDQQLALERSERERLASELGIAKRLQARLLPGRPIAAKLNIAAKTIPATEMGGDYYDVIPAAQQRSWIGIGDVAGHGLDAGLIMLMVQTTISAFARRPQPLSPAEILCAVNEALFDNLRNRLEQRTFVTLTLLHHDGNGTFVYAGAHEEMVVWRAASRSCERIETPGSWLGASRFISERMVESAFRLYPGDILFLYTDGLTEARSASKEQFGLPRLCEALEARAHLPPEVICQELLELVESWQMVQEDDQTAMIIRYG